MRVWNIYRLWCVRCVRCVRCDCVTFVFALHIYHKYMRTFDKNHINHLFRANRDLHMWTRNGWLFHSLDTNTLISFSLLFDFFSLLLGCFTFMLTVQPMSCMLGWLYSTMYNCTIVHTYKQHISHTFIDFFANIWMTAEKNCQERHYFLSFTRYWCSSCRNSSLILHISLIDFYSLANTHLFPFIISSSNYLSQCELFSIHRSRCVCDHLWLCVCVCNAHVVNLRFNTLTNRSAMSR